VLEVCGIRNILTKVHGSANPINLVKATIQGLVVADTREQVAELFTRLDLGLALALSGRGPLDRATKLVDDAAREARGNAALATRARAAQEVVRAER